MSELYFEQLVRKYKDFHVNCRWISFFSFIFLISNNPYHSLKSRIGRLKSGGLSGDDDAPAEDSFHKFDQFAEIPSRYFCDITFTKREGCKNSYFLRFRVNLHSSSSYRHRTLQIFHSQSYTTFDSSKHGEKWFLCKWRTTQNKKFKPGFIQSPESPFFTK